MRASCLLRALSRQRSPYAHNNRAHACAGVTAAGVRLVRAEMSSGRASCVMTRGKIRPGFDLTLKLVCAAVQCPIMRTTARPIDAYASQPNAMRGWRI